LNYYYSFSSSCFWLFFFLQCLALFLLFLVTLHAHPTTLFFLSFSSWFFSTSSILLHYLSTFSTIDYFPLYRSAPTMIN
jgi:hypothetical protein